MAEQNTLIKPFTGLSQLPAVRQIGLLIGLALSIALGIGVVSWSNEPNYVPIFADLAERDMAPVVAVLEQENVKYRLQGSTIAVPAEHVPNLRIRLASQGLPKGGTRGFELLDEEQKFGTSSFLETARYHQALEGELSKSIATLDGVKNARVHLAIPKRSAFLRNQSEASASVLISLYPGSKLNDAQLAGVVHLVSSSVPGMTSDTVAVVDQQGTLLTAGGGGSSGLAMSAEQLGFVRNIERDYSQRIVALLAPIIGAEKVRAQVTADIDFTTIEKTSEVYNPESTSVRSEQTSEEQSTSGGVGGVPGALTNQPPPAGVVAPGLEGAENPSGPVRSSKQATKNYELDRTISHINEAPGSIKRLSVAVVLDYLEQTDDAGKVERAPLPDEEIQRYTQLVQEAVGFDAERGDRINVVNASFLTQPVPEALPETPMWKQAWLLTLGKQLLAIVGVALLIFGVLRPVMASLATYSGTARAAGGRQPAGLDGPLMAGELQLGQDQVSLSSAGVPQLPGTNVGYERQIAMAQSVAKDDPKRAAQVMKSWVAEDE